MAEEDTVQHTQTHAERRTIRAQSNEKSFFHFRKCRPTHLLHGMPFISSPRFLSYHQLTWVLFFTE